MLYTPPPPPRYSTRTVTKLASSSRTACLRGWHCSGWTRTRRSIRWRS
jgi:hypothetical protein